MITELTLNNCSESSHSIKAEEPTAFKSTFPHLCLVREITKNLGNARGMQGRVSRGSSDIPAGFVLIGRALIAALCECSGAIWILKKLEFELEFVMAMPQRLQELPDPTTAPRIAQARHQPGGFLLRTSPNLLPTPLDVCNVIHYQNIATKITSGSNKWGGNCLLMLSLFFVRSGNGIISLAVACRVLTGIFLTHPKRIPAPFPRCFINLSSLWQLQQPKQRVYGVICLPLPTADTGIHFPVDEGDAVSGK